MTSKFDVQSCSLDGWNLVEASAGTGKTWSICALYLRLLLEKELEVKNILVVTFTRAATEELKKRIRTRIEEASSYLDGKTDSCEDRDMLLKLAEKGLVKDRMQKSLHVAFCSFDQAAIMTIHGFCQKAMALCAFSSGQAFDLTADNNDEELVNETAFDFWRKTLNGEKVSTELARWLEYKGLSPEKLAQYLRSYCARPLARKQWPEGTDAPVDRNLSTTLALSSQLELVRQCYQAERCNIAGLLESARKKGLFNANMVKEATYGNALAQADAILAGADAMDFLLGRDALRRLARSYIESATKSKATPPAHPFFDLMDEAFRLADEAEADFSQQYFSLIRHFAETGGDIIRQKKREQRTMAFDDMLSNLYYALINPDLPSLGPTIRSQFPVALIDEFQDTDPLQYSIFSGIYPPGDPENHVFLVGDPKQAIYSFRNADLHTYLKASGEVNAHYTLPNNYRSVPPLVEALNTLFQANSRLFIQEKLNFSPVNPTIEKSIVDAGEKANLRIWTLPEGEPEKLNQSEAFKASLEAMADEIVRLISGSADAPEIDGRPVEAHDIAILVRNHKEAQAVHEVLAARHVGCVSRTQENIFDTYEACDLNLILRSILSPDRERYLLAALSTEILGYDAKAIARLRNDEQQLSRQLENFSQYHDAWRDRGIGYALHALLENENVTGRLLGLASGERRLTNLRQLVEQISRASDVNTDPDALIRWYSSKLGGKNRNQDDELLQLETDRNLVKVMTIHASKGLEFPIVFCPLLWNDRIKAAKHSTVTTYHEGDDMIMTFDITPETIRQTIRIETAAEEMRLFYVALTRAIYRCYLTVGCLAKGSKTSKQDTHSLLNWVAAGNGYDIKPWLAGVTKSKNENIPTETQIMDSWRNLAGRCPSISVSQMPESRHALLDPDQKTENVLKAETFGRTLMPGWRLSSFSGMIRNAISHAELGDHDEYANAVAADSQEAPAPSEKEKSEDILYFPRGTSAGSCIHKVFELADFACYSDNNKDKNTDWDEAIGDALSEYPQQGSFETSTESEDSSMIMLRNMLTNVLDVPIDGNIRLKTVSKSRRLVELPFHLGVSRFSSGKMNDLVRKYYRTQQLSFGSMQAYLNGVVDLVFESDGKFWIVDWKSNHLGFSPRDYDTGNLERAMQQHGYHWQFLLYTVAVNRYLSLAMPGYNYEKHFGGVAYLFIRGVRPDWTNSDGKPAGVYLNRPDPVLIAELDQLLSNPSGSSHDIND